MLEAELDERRRRETRRVAVRADEDQRAPAVGDDGFDQPESGSQRHSSTERGTWTEPGMIAGARALVVAAEVDEHGVGRRQRLRGRVAGDADAGLGEHVVDAAHCRKCGSTCSPKSRICSCRSAPHSSSITCVQPASRYSSIAAMQSAGVPGDRPALVEQRVRDLRLRGEPAALLHRLGDGADLVLLDPGEVEQRVGGALDVLHLVREVHAGDLARAVAARVAVGRVDRGDDGAADVDVGADVLARVADERPAS